MALRIEAPTNVTTLQEKPIGGPARRASRPAGTSAANLRPHVIRAIFRRDFLGYFSNLAGYVFIALFALVCSWVEFCLPVFFANNLANLAPLNEWMPYLLLFFIPAITMGIWAEERRQGTDELLLTLPARDVEVVLGKYLAALGIFTAALGFLLPHVLILMYLGSPDLGVLLATYLGYWLMGAMLIAVGMVASLLSSNATVAFILGALFAAIPIFFNLAGSLLGSLSGWAMGASRVIEDLSVPARFRDFGAGVLTLPGAVYFLSWAVGMLYLNMVLLSRRHWRGGQASSARWTNAVARVLAVALGLASLNVLIAHASARWDLWATILLGVGLALGLAAAAVRQTAFPRPEQNSSAILVRGLALGLVLGLVLNVLFGRGGVRVDASQERLNTASRESIALIDQIPRDRPVFIQAYLSPQVPREYVETRANLVNLLKEFAARGGDKIQMNLVETERFSPAAREAKERFGIESKRVQTSEEGRHALSDIYLGVAFTSGPEEVVVPFFDPGLPVEYELARSIRVVSRAKRKKVGILTTDAKLLGGFNFRSMGQNSEWEIVTELKKQYEVTSVAADADIPSDLDALLVAQPSSLTQKQIDHLTAHVRKGGPTLLLLDPLPATDLSIAPREQRQAPGGMFGGGPPPEPKGNLVPLLDLLGLEWPETQVVWNPYNPTPYRDLQPELVIIGPGSGAPDPCNPKEEASSGLQKVLLAYPGFLRAKGGAGPEFTPLLRTNDLGGTVGADELMQKNFMGASGLVDSRRIDHQASGQEYTVAARLRGLLAAGPEKAKGTNQDPGKSAANRPAEAHVIAIADLDFVSDFFFDLRRQRVEGLDFDNVTFTLNCIDVLAGDDAFIGLRKKRPRHRTLTTLDEQTKVFEKERRKEEKAAEDAADEQLKKAQKDLDAKVDAVKARKDLDERTKEVMMLNLQEVENRRLTNVIKPAIEDQKRQKIQESETKAMQEKRRRQANVQVAALAFPALLPLLLGGTVFFLRSGRENRGASPNRLT